MPASLLESELFGYVEGAFTGASKGGKVGLFELAHQGTIFLDEIGEISPFLQGRLLRVIEEREIMRLGHDEVIPVDIRIIVATNKNIHELVEQGKFREDLLYRLDVLRLNIPPVRFRGNDISLLINHFLSTFLLESGKEIPKIAPECWEYLMNQDWHGNVRQIRNFCERLSVVLESNSLMLKDVICSYEINPAVRQKTEKINNPREVLEETEKSIIILALKNSSNREEAAQKLGIDRSTLWRKMKRFNIKDYDFENWMWQNEK